MKRTCWKIFVVLFLLGWLSNATLAAQSNIPSAQGNQPIAASAAVEIKAILAEKASRTPNESKLDSNLLQAARAFSKAAAGIAATPPTYVQNFIQANVSSEGTIKVTIKLTPSATGTDGIVRALMDMGATDLNAVRGYGEVTARLPVDSLLTVAGWPDVRQVGLFIPGSTNRYVPTPEEQQALNAQLKSIASLNIVYPANVIAHGADVLQERGITGTGVKVCVLSDGVDSLSAEQTAGRLPAVDVVAGQAGSGDEGTAMLEIVHQMAPGAALGFASGFTSATQFAANIIALRNAPHNCDIIVDDITYFLEAAFQDGPIAQAVNTIVSSGALYFSSAANSGSLAKSTSGTWEGDFVNSGTTIGAISALETGTIHSFNGSNTNTLTAQGGSRMEVLSWSDPMGASCNDYDLFILNSTLTTVLAASTNIQSCTQGPQEYIYNVSIPAGSKIVILNYQGMAATRALRLDTERGRLSIGTNGNTFGHNAAASAITVAAVNVTTAGGGVFVGGTANPVTYYSSDGPRRIFYSPAGVAITPGNVLYGTNGGSLLNKVDISAADCVATGVTGFTTFCGTSAAAPHAAAIAALLKSGGPSLTPNQIQTIMNSTALDIEAAEFDVNSGNGLLRADRAYTAITYTISGNAGVAGATLSYTDGTAKTATADGTGAYSFAVSYNWSGTVTPTKTGYSFSPANISYTDVLANKTGQNYTATAITYTISGNAGAAGATLSYTDGTAKTATADGTGAYSFAVSYNWSGTVTPTKTGYAFNPANISYTDVLANKTGQNYTATYSDIQALIVTPTPSSGKFDGLGSYLTAPSDQHLTNGSFETWSAGNNSAPDGWIVGGPGAAIVREAVTKKGGTYSAKLTRNGADAYLSQFLENAKGHDMAYWKGRTATFGCWVYQTVANSAVVGITDGFSAATVKTTPLINQWVYLTVSQTLAQTAVMVQPYLQVTTTDTSVYFDGAYFTDDAVAGFTFGTGDFTIDTWVRLSAPVPDYSHVVLYSQYDSVDNYIFVSLYKHSGTGTIFPHVYGYRNGVNFNINTNLGSDLLVDIWYRIEISRENGAISFFLDGIKKPINSSLNPEIDLTFEGEVRIGAENSRFYLNGFLDEFRVSKGIARHNASFTPPATLYTADTYTKLLLHFDGEEASTVITDSSTVARPVTAKGEAKISRSVYPLLYLPVNEGGSNSNITVRLNAQPAGNIAVTVSRTAGDADLYVSSGANLTFTTANWNVPQTATLSAAQDADYTNGTSTFTVASTGLASQTVLAMEVDDDPATPTSPTATTNAASGVTTTGATLNGTINANNASTVVTFQYGLTTSYGTTVTATPSPVTGTSDTAVSKAITGLAANTTYHYMVVGVNSAGTTNGSDLTFTTSAIVPSATTNAATGVTTSEATLNGMVNANNSSTTVTFQYGLTTAYGSTVTADQSPVTGSSNTAVSKAITGLSPNMTYHYRVVGVNSAGTTNGSDLTFTTLADQIPPTLNITSHSNGQHVTTSSITLIGTASDSGKGNDGVQQVTVNGVRASNDTATGSGTANWSKAVALNAGTNSITVIAYDNSTNHNSTTVMLTIYYDSAPSVTTGPATNLTQHSATLKGTVNPNGLSTTYYFEWGTTTAYGNKSPASPASAGSGWGNTDVSANLTGLTLNTNYHYRLVAINSLGTTYGTDMSFMASVKAMPWLLLLLGD